MSTWLAFPLQTPTPAPSPTPDCAKASEFCQWIYDQTSNRWFASASYYLLLKPSYIVLIIVLALVCRTLLHRAINRLVERTSNGGVPTMLRPLRHKLPTSLREAATLFPERRRQRAAAIGSVLRSFASASIFAITALMVLNELGVDLAPLIASAGIVGVAIGFGAQTLVKDLIAGLFMLLEDQYGVGDVVDVGQASGTVESVGLRITTIRDGRGVLWYVRNGEIVKVGNKSQGWAVVVVDVPIGLSDVDQATQVMRDAAAMLGSDEAWADDLMDEPEVLGVEQITIDGAVLRTTVKTTPEAQWRVGRELRRRLTEALVEVGLSTQAGGGRVFVQRNADAASGQAETDQAGPPGADRG